MFPFNADNRLEKKNLHLLSNFCKYNIYKYEAMFLFFYMKPFVIEVV